MYTDKKVLYTFCGVTLTTLLLLLFLPGENSGGVLAALLLLPLSVLTYIFVKKRSILSINKREILLITLVFGVVYLVLYYLTGIPFGFYQNIYLLSVKNFFPLTRL